MATKKENLIPLSREKNMSLDEASLAMSKQFSGNPLMTQEGETTKISGLGPLIMFGGEETPPKPAPTRAQAVALKQAEPPKPEGVWEELYPPAPEPIPEPMRAASPVIMSESVAAPEVREPASNLNWDWGEIAIGLTPVLAGYLAGDTASGYGVGGKGLQDRQKQLIDINNENIKNLRAQSLKKQSTPSDKGRYQVRAVEKDGQIIYATYDTATGKFMEDADPNLTGYKPSIVTDPSTDEKIRVTSSNVVTPVKGLTNRNLTVKQEKELSKLTNTLLKDDKFTRARRTVSEAGRALALLESNNPISDAGIKTIFPRMFGEVGNIAVQEGERWGGSPDLPTRYESLKQKYFRDGTITEKDRRDLLEVARVMKAYAEGTQRQAYASHKASFQNIQGYDPSPYIKSFLSETTPDPKQVKATSDKRDPTKSKHPYITQDGQLFKLSPTGEYREVER